MRVLSLLFFFSNFCFTIHSQEIIDPVSLTISNVELVKYNPVDYPNTAPFDPYYIVYLPNDSGYIYKALVSSNFEWEAHPVMDSAWDPYYENNQPIWFSLNIKAGELYDTLEIKVMSKNHMLNHRLNGFKITCEGIEKEILVNQDGTASFFSIAKSSVLLDSLTNSRDSLYIHTNMNWFIESSIPWVTITPFSGHGHSKLTFVAMEDTEPGIPHYGSIIIKDENNNRKLITVYQSGRKLVLTIPEITYISDVFGIDTIDYYCNAPLINVQKNYMNKLPEFDEWFNIRFDSVHIYIDHESGFNVSYPWNTQPGSRYSSFVVSTSTAAEEHWFQLIQNVSHFKFSPDSIFSDSGQDTVVKVNINADINWKIDHKPQWIEISKSVGLGEDSINISLAPNHSGLIRYDTIKVSCGDRFQHAWAFPIQQKSTITDLSSENEIQSTLHNKFVIVPNPNNGRFHIMLKEPLMIKSEITITDVKGLIIYESVLTPEADFIELSVNSLVKGIYIVRIKNAQWNSTNYLSIQTDN